MSNAILAIHNYGGPIHEQFDENALATIEALRIKTTGLWRFQYRVEKRLQVFRRTADNLAHLRCRGLSLQRLGKILRALRNSLSSRAFSMAMTAWAAKFVSSSICLSVNGCTSWR